jgi:hypothetical protein
MRALWIAYLSGWGLLALAIVGPLLWRCGEELLLACRRRKWARLERPGFPVVPGRAKKDRA